MKVHARFYLNRITRMQAYYKVSDEEEAKNVEGCFVELNAVKGEPFGSATPNGSLSMGIVNPDAAQLFINARVGQEFDLLISPVESTA